MVYAEEFREKWDKDPMKDVDGKQQLKDDFIDKIRNGYDKIFKMIESAADATHKEPSEEKTLEEMFKEMSVIIKLHLDDAVQVLRTIAQGPQSQPSFTAAEIQSMVAEQVSALLANNGRGGPLAHSPPLGNNGDRRNNKNGNGNGKKRKQHGQGQGNRNSSNDRNSRGPQPEKRRKRLNELMPDANNHCIDCGSKTHKRGDEECKNMSWDTKKIREAKKRDNQNGEQTGFREDFSQ